MTKQMLIASLVGGVLLLLIVFSLQSGLSSGQWFNTQIPAEGVSAARLPAAQQAGEQVAFRLNSQLRNGAVVHASLAARTPAIQPDNRDPRITLVPAAAAKVSLHRNGPATAIHPKSRAAMGVATGDWRQLEKPQKSAPQTLPSGVLGGIHFKPGSSTLSADSAPRLQQIAKVLGPLQDVYIEIGGHTDNTGNADRNQQLSQLRADAVVQYLISRGVNATRISAQGYGQSRPIADNSSVAGRQKNRRVELILHKRP